MGERNMKFWKRKPKTVETELKLIRVAINLLAGAIIRSMRRSGNKKLIDAFVEEWGSVEKGFSVIDAAKPKKKEKKST